MALTEAGRLLIKAEIQQRLERKECQQCGERVWATTNEENITCGDHQ